MKSAERQVLRVAVLRVLEANSTKYGLSVDAITLRLWPMGFETVTAPEV